MPGEFEGDLTGAVFWGADLTGAEFRDVNLSGVSISHALLVDVHVDALVQRLVINGVDVTDYVNEGDEWYPLRTLLRPEDVAGMRLASSALTTAWAAVIARAEALPEGRADESVDGEFSVIQTLRHLTFALDKWFTVPVLGEPYHPTGLPNTGSLDFPWPGLDYDLRPTLAEALAVRADRMTRFDAFLAALDGADFERSIDVAENGPHPLRECLYTVFEEEFWHLRYATRDLAVVESSAGSSQ
jgi:hypothetical protein